MNSDSGRSLAELYGAIFLLGCAPLFAKVIALPAHEIIGLRSIFGVLALGLLLVLMKERFSLGSRREMLMMGLVGLVMTVHWVTYFHSIQVSTVAVALIGFFTFPVITVLLEPLFFRDLSLSPKSLLSALGVFLGGTLVAGVGGAEEGTVVGLLWGVASATLLALRNILIKRHLGRHPGTVVMWYQMAIVAVVLLPTLSWSGETLEGDTLVSLIVLGVVFTAGAHTLFVRSLTNLSARTVSIVFCMQPLVGVALAALLLDEIPGWYTVAGGLVIVGLAGVESVRAAAAGR